MKAGKFKIKMPAYWVMVKAFHDQGRECLKLSVGPYQRSERLGTGLLIYMDIKITGITGIIQLSMTGAKFF